ncbi:MAG: 3-oxoacid CoA-transferase subunit A [Bacteroidales bacterium]|jgi:acetate CoA/acetoacetate CoA-transferase alpha subunit|nr:3-oxoacid CoA-transferase subunit A [Bacteroidales bacterium]MDD2264260.1 3-oxoacid CoA-transferase subunit A [Bacteroidales bacterium]MDD2831494.1 3-oxoacid CoA-transferase subunit A [Bacteroidales bacterium]MDD3208488.1 3-oxoacid CoA-transferase subunit A [Bacteroidales bacterium]MDD3697099.1 3-oxoacid CoA-transferase subunit A [Bacteroidales bacterium]
MSKQISLQEAVLHVKTGMSVMVGGFLGVGSPHRMIDAILDTGIKDLTIITNDTAFADKGVGKLIAARRVVKVITSHIGTNTSTGEQYHAGELEVIFVPQGTLIEQIRCAGAGLGGILTPTGLGTVVEIGKEVIHVDGKNYLLEKPLKADVALLGASIADEEGNLYFKGNSRNFNSIMAMAADLVIAEAKEIVKTGSILPENVHTQSIFVDYIVR